MGTNYQDIYEHLGYLFYSVSASDQEVEAKGVQRLKEFISCYWIPMEGTVDESSTDAAHYILIVFDRLFAQNADPDEAFKFFEEFYNSNPHVFTCTIKHRISDTAGSIAYASGNATKTEHRCLSRLNALLTDDQLVNQVHG